MKIIDLLNKIANGEEVPKKIRISHWCYKFEWVEHLTNYYDKSNDIDLMSCLSMNKEELNYEVEILEEDKKIEKIKIDDQDRIQALSTGNYVYKVNQPTKNIIYKINELIDKVNSLEKNQ